MRLIQNISFYLVIGFITTVFSLYLKSDFLFEYLQKNIISLLITLLAINTATLGLIASKIQDMLENHPKINFKNTIREMKFSLTEQVILICISIFSLIILKSEIIIFPHKNITLNTILVSVLTYSINILWDTGKSVFIIIELIQNMNNKK